MIWQISFCKLVDVFPTFVCASAPPPPPPPPKEKQMSFQTEYF